MAMVNTGVGVSQQEDVVKAAKEAAEEAKKQAKNPKLLMVFITFNYPSEKYQEAISEVQKVFSEEIPMIGGGALGFFAKDKSYDAFHTGGKVKAVGVFALESEYLNVGVGIGTNAEKDSVLAGKQALSNALDNLDYNPSLAYLAMTQRGAKDLINIRPINALLLTPGVTSNHLLLDSRILEGISQVAKRTVRLAGGGLNQFDFDKISFPTSYQFFNGKVYEESVISVVFGSDLEIGYGVGSGYEVVGPGVFVTKGEGWVIEELNGRPALDVFKELLLEHTHIKEEEIGENLISIGCQGITLGVSEATGDFFWPNFPLQVVDGNKIMMFEEIRKGMGLSLLKLDKGYCLEGMRNSAEAMKEDAGVDSFDFIMFFSCGGRGVVLEEDYGEEVEAIRKTVKGNPTIVGLVSCGEQGFYKTGPMMATKLNIPMMGISNTLLAEEE